MHLTKGQLSSTKNYSEQSLISIKLPKILVLKFRFYVGHGFHIKTALFFTVTLLQGTSVYVCLFIHFLPFLCFSFFHPAGTRELIGRHFLICLYLEILQAIGMGFVSKSCENFPLVLFNSLVSLVFATQKSTSGETFHLQKRSKVQLLLKLERTPVRNFCDVRKR